MMPAVTVFSRPKGEPIAATHSPTRALEASPIRTVGRFFESILTRAPAVRGHTLAGFAVNSRLSWSLTVNVRVGQGIAVGAHDETLADRSGNRGTLGRGNLKTAEKLLHRVARLA